MGNKQSHEENAAKAHKLDWEARQARERAEAASRGVPYTKKKYLPPGTYEARPYGMVTEETRTQTTVGPVSGGAPSGAQFRAGGQPHMFDRQSQPYAETRPQPAQQVWYQPERREVEFEATPAERPEQEAIGRQARPAYRVMDVSQNYDASQGPAQHQQPPTEVRYPPVQSWTQREEHPSAAQYRAQQPQTSQTQTQQTRVQTSSDTRLLEIPPEGASAIERLKQKLSREKLDLDRKMKSLEQIEHQEALKFRKAVEREKEMRLIEEREIETLADLRRERAELLRRQRQLKENEQCRQQILKETKPMYERAYEARYSSDDPDLARLREIEKEEQALDKQLEFENAIAAQSKTAADAEEARLAKVRQAEEQLRQEMERLNHAVQELRFRERTHAIKMKELRAREAELAKKDKELRAAHQLKEQQAHQLAEAEFNKALPLHPVDAELSELEKRARELDEAENEAKNRESEAMKQLRLAQKECDETRASIEKIAGDREKLEASRPVVPAKQVCAEILPVFKQKTEELRTSTTRKVTPSQPRETTTIGEKFSQFADKTKEAFTGKSMSTSSVPEAPQLSEKEKAEYIEREKRHPMYPDHPSGSELQKQHERLHHVTTHVHSCPCPVTHGSIGSSGRSPVQPGTRLTNVGRELSD